MVCEFDGFFSWYNYVLVCACVSHVVEVLSSSKDLGRLSDTELKNC